MDIKTEVFLKRLARGFLAGFVSALALSLTQTTLPDITNKEVITSIIMGAFTGGILALEKMLRWEDEV